MELLNRLYCSSTLLNNFQKLVISSDGCFKEGSALRLYTAEPQALLSPAAGDVGSAETCVQMFRVKHLFVTLVVDTVNPGTKLAQFHALCGKGQQELRTLDASSVPAEEHKDGDTTDEYNKLVEGQRALLKDASFTDELRSGFFNHLVMEDFSFDLVGVLDPCP